MDSVNYGNKEFAHNAHSVGVSEYHLQWVTKYRYETLLKASYHKGCENALYEAAKRHGIVIKELGVMPDRVRIVVLLPPNMSVPRAINLLKGASSYNLFRMHPNSRLRYPRCHFWGRGYLYRSVSTIDDETVRKYVREDNDPRQVRLT